MLSTLATLAVSAPFNDLDEVLIPLVAIVGGISIPIVAIIVSFRKQKLQATLIERAIEQGLTVEEIDELLKRQGFQEGEQGRVDGKPRVAREVPFRKGFVLMAVGGAFFLAENPHLYGGGWHHGGFIGAPGVFVSFLLGGIGAAFVVSDLLAILLGKSKQEQ